MARSRNREDEDLALPPGAPDPGELDDNGNLIPPAQGPAEDGEDERLIRAADGQRRTGAAYDPDRDPEGGLASSQTEYDPDFDEWTQEQLPRLPPLPGYHYCWLSTTNQSDPIHKRVSLGYEPVTPEDLPGFAHMSMKSAAYPGGIISVNEMLLFKIRDERHNKHMYRFHHSAPLSEESSIRRNSQALAEEHLDSRGKSLVKLEEGMQGLGVEPRRRPTFSS